MSFTLREAKSWKWLSRRSFNLINHQMKSIKHALGYKRGLTISLKSFKLVLMAQDGFLWIKIERKDDDIVKSLKDETRNFICCFLRLIDLIDIILKQSQENFFFSSSFRGNRREHNFSIKNFSIFSSFNSFERLFFSLTELFSHFLSSGGRQKQ